MLTRVVKGPESMCEVGIHTELVIKTYSVIEAF